MADRIGLLAAMPQETRALLRQVLGWKRSSIGRLPAYSLSIAGYSCTLVTSGMGGRRAHHAARLLIETIHPHWIVSFGIAGAVEADLDIGDVVLPGACYTWDGDRLGAQTTLATWSGAAIDVARQSFIVPGRRVFLGTAITTTGSQPGLGQLGNLPHPVLEMETAAIARVADENGIPALSLRAISDGPRAPIPIDLGEVMDEDANLMPGKMIQAVLRDPKILLKSRQMLRNTTLASENAAMTLKTILSISESFAC
jgi:adenosylhomocysteine nucleosidase